MKTINKTCGTFAVVTAVLLVTAALITTCVAPVDGTLDGYTPPPGKGAIRLSVGNNSNGRSILPTGGVIFTQYTYSFQEYTDNTYATTVGSPTMAVPVAATSITTPIPLAVGFYKVTIIGQTGTSPTFTNVATGVSAGFSIVAGASTPVTVPIGPYAWDAAATDPGGAGNGNGTFTYTISYGAIVPSAFDMTITTIPGMGNLYANSGTKVSITGQQGVKQTLTLPSGFYFVMVELTSGGGKATTFDVLHIYQGLTSDFIYTFNPAQFPAGSNVVINPSYTDPTDNKPTFTAAAVGTNPGVIAENGSITLSKDIAGTPTPTPEADIVSLSNAGSFASYSWYVDGAPAGTASTPLTITAGTAPFTVNKTYMVTAVGMTATGVYSSKFYVEITD